jgi:hypothetical protein
MIRRTVFVRSFVKTIAELLGSDTIKFGSLYTDIFVAYGQ